MAYILNKFNVIHTIPDAMPLPAGARLATPAEVAAWEKADRETKATILAAKQKKAQDRAQLVVVTAAPEVAPPLGAAEPSSPSAFSKTPGDNKPKGPKHDAGGVRTDGAAPGQESDDEPAA